MYVIIKTVTLRSGRGGLGVKGIYSSCRGLSSIPRTHVGQISTACNSNSKGLTSLASKGTCTHVYNSSSQAHDLKILKKHCIHELNCNENKLYCIHVYNCKKKDSLELLLYDGLQCFKTISNTEFRESQRN